VEDWVRQLGEARVPVSPVRDLAAVFAAPEAATIVATVDDPERGPLLLVKNPIAGLPLRPPTPPPLLGQDTEDVRRRGWET
jgi:crotonobetainyl-CoA:carnitine CoA-transferase CaiB-like acyl-CoA transferase